MKKERKKMKVVPGMTDPANVMGFVKVKNFDGVSMHINPRYFKTLLKMMVIFDDLDDIEIGISDTGPAKAFFIFTDEKRGSAIGVVGRTE